MNAESGPLFRGKTTIAHVMPELGTIEASGSDVRSWLNGIATCDLLPRKIGDGAFGLAVGKTGKILAELYIALLAEDRFLIGARRVVVPALMEHFDKYVVMEDVALADVSDQHVWLFLHGAPAKTYAGAVAEAGGQLLPLDFTGTATCAVVAPASAATAVREAITAHGKETLLWATDEDWNAFRVERGIAWYGHDFDEQSYAQEAALERLAVSFQKGCYLGQEAVFMLQVRGHVKKRLVQLAIDPGAAVEKGTAISLPDGSSIGSITSVAPGPEGKTLALGHVKYKYARPGEAFRVAGAPAISTSVIPAPKE